MRKAQHRLVIAASRRPATGLCREAWGQPVHQGRPAFYPARNVMFELATRFSDGVAASPCEQGLSGPSPELLPSVASDAAPRHRPDTVRTRRRNKARQIRFREAVTFALAIDLPLNVGLTIVWHALPTAGEHNDGRCLWRAEPERELYVRKEISRLCRNEGLPFAALWGRDVGRKMKFHGRNSSIRRAGCPAAMASRGRSARRKARRRQGSPAHAGIDPSRKGRA